MAPVMLEVVRIRTFGAFFMLSNWVRRALTTLKASLGSDPDIEFFLAAVSDSTSSMSTHTKDLVSSINLLISVNIFCTSLLDSENQLEKRLWELISTSWVVVYLLDNSMESFCARALHKLVLPVPGGPWSNTTLLQQTIFLSTPCSESSREVDTNLSKSVLMLVSYTRF